MPKLKHRLALSLLTILSLALSSLPCFGTYTAKVETIRVSPRVVANISPWIYGVTYNWDVNPANTFSQWQNAMQQTTHYRMAQFGGGWNAEHYVWENNTCPKYHQHNEVYDPQIQPAGVDPSTFATQVPQAQFIIPDSAVVKQDDPDLRKTAVDDIVAQAKTIVAQYSSNAYGAHAVRSYVIGNEWWIENHALDQDTPPSVTVSNRDRYAQLLKAVVPAMKRVNPSIQVFALADWLHPEQYYYLRQRVGETVWSQIDGVAVHAYVQTVEGYGVHKHLLYSHIANQIDCIRKSSGKNLVFDSQWSLTPASQDKSAPPATGLSNANWLVLTFKQLALAKVEGAMIWPAVGFANAADFFDSVYAGEVAEGGDFVHPHASGILFGWMSQYYEGQALETIEGEMPAAVAQIGSGSQRRLSVIVPSLRKGLVHVKIPLKNLGVCQIDSAEVMCSADPNDQTDSREVNCVKLPAFITRDAEQQPTLHFYLNPGDAGRGSNWEIARVTLK